MKDSEKFNLLLKQELERSINPVYFTENYVKIVHPKKGIINFDLYDYQADLLRAFKKNRFNIVLKARQLGVSTIVAAHCLHRAFFKNNQNILVCATKLDTAKNIVGIIKNMYNGLPKAFKMINPLIMDNITGIRLSNGSIIQSSTTTEDLGRSQALSLLVIDEAAWVKKPNSLEKIWASLRPTLATGGDCIIISTPNGIGNKFYELYKEAEEGKNEFVPHKLMWYLRYDKEWFEKECKDKTPQEIAQEYCCEFIGSGKTVIDVNILSNIGNNIIKDKDLITQLDDGINIYKLYENNLPDNSANIMFCDVSRGENSGDYNAFHIVDIVNKVQFCDFKAKIDINNYVNIVLKYAIKYNASIMIENNGVGHSLISSLLMLYREKPDYTIEGSKIEDIKIICETHARNITNVIENINEFVEENSLVTDDIEFDNIIFYFYSDDLDKGYFGVPLKWLDIFCRANNATKGFTLSGKSRDMEIMSLIHNFNKYVIDVKLPRLIDELYTFVWKGNRAMADNNCHDDLVMSFAMACLFVTELNKNNNIDMMTAQFSNDTKTVDMTINNITVEHDEEKNKIIRQSNINDKPKNEIIIDDSIKWLLK